MDKIEKKKNTEFIGNEYIQRQSF